jgi:ubiquinone/menaquinone biosynthesis C-methylase UbiE
MSFLVPILRRLPRIKLPFSSRGLPNSYETLYESQARQMATDDAVGGGPYDLMGRLELEILEREGLRPEHTLVDFGCGNGRLAVHAAAYLSRGSYCGIDISPTFLRLAQRRTAASVPAPTCRVSWQRQTGDCIPLPDCSADRMCAFSVFTHMEHEDTYRYLCEARRVVRPGGQMVYSCLPMTLAYAQKVFLVQAAQSFSARWRQVRNIVTTIELMNSIATLAGWRVVRWIAGDEQYSRLPGYEGWQFGQSVCILE